MALTDLRKYKHFNRLKNGKTVDKPPVLHIFPKGRLLANTELWQHLQPTPAVFGYFTEGGLPVKQPSRAPGKPDGK